MGTTSCGETRLGFVIAVNEHYDIIYGEPIQYADVTWHADVVVACSSVTWDPAIGGDSSDDSEVEDHQDDDPFNLDPFESTKDEDVFDDNFPYQP